jgi:hypothetical protein
MRSAGNMWHETFSTTISGGGANQYFGSLVVKSEAVFWLFVWF